MTVRTHWTHLFRMPYLPIGLSDNLFQYRNPHDWLVDLCGAAGLAIEGPEISHFSSRKPGNEFLFDVTGSEQALRFICVALNQHAEQSPSDPTPPTEADRLEETLREPATTKVAACSNCGSTNRWKIDTDVTFRAAILLADGKARRLIDLVGSEPLIGSSDIGQIDCTACGCEVLRTDDAWNVLAMAANDAVDDGDRWELMTDYRQL